MCVHTSCLPYEYPHLMLCSWQRTHWNPCNLWHLCHHCAKCWFPHGTRTITCASFNHIQLLSQHCAYQRWHLHLNIRCHYRPNVSRFISPILCNSRICCIGCNSSQGSSSQGKELSQLTPQWSIPPFNNWNLVVYTNMPMRFYMIVSMPFGAWKGQKTFIFLPWSFFFILITL
jgi:hypothetical protein